MDVRDAYLRGSLLALTPLLPSARRPQKLDSDTRSRFLTAPFLLSQLAVLYRNHAVPVSLLALYASLVQDAALRGRVFAKVKVEFDRTLKAVLAVPGQRELLEKNQVLARSIRLRNPYVDPMSLIQVDLLRRKRAGEDTPEVNRAIAGTINGISAGLRNTG